MFLCKDAGKLLFSCYLGDWVNDRGLLKALFESGAVSRCDTESAIHAAKVAKFSLESAKLE
jgi:hypothetical protein